MNSNQPNPIRIAFADCQTMFRTSLAQTLQETGSFKVTISAATGAELIARLQQSDPFPDACILDIQLSDVDGFQLMDQLQERWPDLRVLILSSYDHEATIIRMLRKGAAGYLSKSGDLAELQKALFHVCRDGYYATDRVNSRIHHLIHQKKQGCYPLDFSEKEIEVLRYSCTELSYAQMAARMNLSPRTVQGYRDSLFQKLGITSRTQLAMFAIQSGLVTHIPEVAAAPANPLDLSWTTNTKTRKAS